MSCGGAAHVTERSIMLVPMAISAAAVPTTRRGAELEFCETATGEVGGRRCWPRVAG